jgi:two-component system NtrC family sensor kinase
MERVVIETLLAALDLARIGAQISMTQDGQLQPMYANRIGASRLGYTVEELQALPWLDTVAEHEQSRVVALLSRILAGETAPAVLAVELRHRDGHPVPSELMLTQRDIPGGHLFVAIMRDLGYLPSLEADRMAVVGALAAGIAHEINNPLTYILLHLRSLRRTIEDGAGSQMVDAARRIDEAFAGAERIRAITRSVMTFAAAPGPPVDVDLGTVVQSALRIARPELEKNARVVCQIFPVSPVRAEEARLGQTVLSMLLFASAAFSGDDPTPNRVVIALEMRADHVVLEISDNGRDLSQEDLARSLDPAYIVRCHDDTPGFGLGMARAIAMGAGGRLEVAPRPGGGVTTTLSLPAVAAEPQQG